MGERFLQEFREQAESYIDERGSGKRFFEGEISTLAFAFAVAFLICALVPIVICFLVKHTVAVNADLAFVVAASAVLAVVGVLAFDHDKRLEFRYAGFRKSKKLRANVHQALAEKPYKGELKRVEVAQLAQERLEGLQKRQKTLQRLWKVMFFFFVALMAFGLSMTHAIVGFMPAVWWALVPFALYVVFQVANCRNERDLAFYDFATTIL